MGLETLLNGQTAANAVGGAFNMEDLLKKFSITGNIMLDTMILMNAYTFFKAYIEMLGSFVKTNSLNVIQFVFFYVRSFLKSKLTGRVVFKTSLDQKHQLYNSCFKEIIEKDIPGDVHEDWKFKWLKIEDHLGDNKTSYFQQWRLLEESYAKHSELSLNYTDPNDKLRYKATYGMSDQVTKIFSHTVDKSIFKGRHLNSDVKEYFDCKRTFYIRIIWKKYEHSTSTKDETAEVIEKCDLHIDLILFDTPKGKISKESYFMVLKHFLTERFQLFEKMLYTYTVSFGSDSKMYYDVLQCAKYRDANDHWATYGDDSLELVDQMIQMFYFDKLEKKNEAKDKWLEKNSSIVLKVSPKDMFHDYREDITVQSGDISEYGRQRLLLRIFNAKTTPVLIFQFQGVVYYFTTCTLICAKIGDFVTEHEVRSTIQHMIECNLKYRAQRKDDDVQSNPNKNQVYVYKRVNESWQSSLLSKRSFETIYLPNSLKQDLRKEFDNFLQMQHLYKNYEIPYRKGVLFYGPPGTGKTSVVKAIAYEYQIPLYILDVNDEEINDDSILEILNSLGGNGLKILLFEDVDTAFADKERVAKESKYHQQHLAPTDLLDANKVAQPVQHRKFLTYSGLLNALDGVMSNQTGVITIMTTNYIERLGQAFMRAGRIDCKFELKECNREQIEQMVTFFVKNRISLAETVFKKDLDPEGQYKDDHLIAKAKVFSAHLVDSSDQSHLKPCDLQSYLLKHIDRIENVFSNVESLKKK